MLFALQKDFWLINDGAVWNFKILSDKLVYFITFSLTERSIHRVNSQNKTPQTSFPIGFMF